MKKKKGRHTELCKLQKDQIIGHTMKLWERVTERRLRQLHMSQKISLVLCLGGLHDLLITKIDRGLSNKLKKFTYSLH